MATWISDTIALGLLEASAHISVASENGESRSCVPKHHTCCSQQCCAMHAYVDIGLCTQ